MGRPVVAVIGAGFSGLLTSLHLLADPAGPTVRLFERRGVFGRGLAYATDNAEHLLNVRAANMSAFPDQPEHFTAWLATHGGWGASGAFVTRGAYGAYLQSLLRDAVSSAGGQARLLLEADAVERVTRHQGGGYRLLSAMGRVFEADAIVLATGASISAPLPGLDSALVRSPRYVADPWRPAGLPLDLGEHVLLVGSGLTMVDVAISRAAPGRRFTVISRRGLPPSEHGAAAPAPGREDLRGSPREVLRWIRREAAGRDWREVVDEARGSVRGLWLSWSADERQAFLRHLRPWWDAHRHRMAPMVAHRIAEMEGRGAFSLYAGSITSLALNDYDIEAVWRPRGSRRARRLRIDTVVNCTGRQGDVRRTADPLLRGLLTGGLARADACGLGFDVDPQSRLLDPADVAAGDFYAVGPLTRGAFWEITAVPDIRLQAAEVGRHLLARYANR